MRRARRTDWWPLVAVLFVVGLGGGFAAKAAARITLGYLGGVWRAWYSSYNGSTYYGLQPAASAALAAIAATARASGGIVGRAALEAWLDAFDPLGLVRAAIDAGTVEESPLFDPVPEGDGFTGRGATGRF